MKKQVLSILLTAAVVLSTVTIPVCAENTQNINDSVPILTGFADVDYQADQILSEIPVAGKSTTQQIQEVYDWIILHCKRNDWDGTYYYDEQAVEAAALTYGEAMEQRIYRGEAVIRKELAEYWNINDEASCSFDSNYCVAYKAREMMLKRTGDCVNFSSLFAVLLGHLGYDCRVIPGHFINSNGSKVSHKWNYVLINGQYYWFDIRIDHSFYVKKGTNSHTYFMISDTAAWEKTHDWNHSYSDCLAANASVVAGLYGQAIQFAAEKEPYDEVDPNDGSLYNFYVTNEYLPGQFRDVREGDWYAENVKTAFEYGILLGFDDGRFGVGDNLTVGQTLAIADRLHNRYYGGSGQFYQGVPWYQVYVEYADKYGISSSGQYDPLAVATRAQFAVILSAALPDKAIPAVNRITSIPDVKRSDSFGDSVYRLYNAGILTGNDSNGTFEPNTPIKREQVAAMVTRFADQSLRKKFSLK